MTCQKITPDLQEPSNIVVCCDTKLCKGNQPCVGLDKVSTRVYPTCTWKSSISTWHYIGLQIGKHLPVHKIIVYQNTWRFGLALHSLIIIARLRLTVVPLNIISTIIQNSDPPSIWYQNSLEIGNNCSRFGGICRVLQHLSFWMDAQLSHYYYMPNDEGR